MYNLGHCEHNKFKPSSSLTISQETFSLTDQRLNGDLATLALWLPLQVKMRMPDWSQIYLKVVAKNQLVGWLDGSYESTGQCLHTTKLDWVLLSLPKILVISLHKNRHFPLPISKQNHVQTFFFKKIVTVDQNNMCKLHLRQRNLGECKLKSRKKLVSAGNPSISSPWQQRAWTNLLHKRQNINSTNET